MKSIPSLVIELYQLYSPNEVELKKMSDEQKIKQLRGSVDSLIHLVVGMMVAGDLTMEKIEKLGETLKGKK